MSFCFIYSGSIREVTLQRITYVWRRATQDLGSTYQEYVRISCASALNELGCDFLMRSFESPRRNDMADYFPDNYLFYLVRRRCTLIAQQSLGRLRTAFGDESSCKTTIYNWFAEFKRGRINLNHEFRGGRPSTAVSNKNLDAARRMIETDTCDMLCENWISLGIGMRRIPIIILYKHLGMKKLSSRWISYNLTEAQKTDRVT
ncbi:Putative uncharacterized protein FLJ37770 [Eumeta japonica]|uniref:Mos1 transposase HTH domain-containing protein n=1 Tax=Eumeta variegata TaxID=151549 RepID=A0A4C1VLR1_EUMVA|nr:Putative uncharacterized protein FLJ37770 [Eumeta japonica]